MAGIDYSDRGLELAEMLMRRAGVDGHLIKGDVLTFIELPERRFDLVFSLGFIEHFEHPVAVLYGSAAQFDLADRF